MGPEGSIRLPHAFTESERQVFETAIASITCRKTPSQFFICNTKPIGGTYEGEEWPFEMTTYLTNPGDWEDAAVFEKCFGFKPHQHVQFWAWRNGASPHRIIGEICLWVAEQFGGIVRFGGALHPHAYDCYGIEDGWETVRPYSHEMLAGLPGKWLEIPYKTARGTTWVSHNGDAIFMRAWLAHPKFHMIK